MLFLALAVAQLANPGFEHGLILAVPRAARTIEIGFRLERTQSQLDADDVRAEIPG